MRSASTQLTHDLNCFERSDTAADGDDDVFAL
jgi:hypothetical protein